jgi:hypothetical protein
MQKAAAANHATHDELLIARLHGDDVDSRERARALDRVAGCDECAALYADLGAIATATTALPVQRRPRDFALTDEDAARLRPRRRSWARLLTFGRRRSFGGALAALGFSGLVLTGAVSMLGTAAPSLTSLTSDREAAPQAVDAASPNYYSQGGVAAASPAAIPAPATPAPAKAVESAGPPAVGTPGGVETVPPAANASPPAFGPIPSSALDQAGPTAGPAVAGGTSSTAFTAGPAPGEALTSGAAQPGPDWRQLFVAGSVAALALGLAFLLLPAIRRRSRGGARH